MTAALDDSAANPCGDSTVVIRLPIVLMIRQPPLAVPSAIDSAQPNLTQNGTLKWAALMSPWAISASEITPIVFWASLVPCASDTSDAEPICPYRYPVLASFWPSRRISR